LTVERIDFRHNGGVNALFMDVHVATFKQEQLYNNTKNIYSTNP